MITLLLTTAQAAPPAAPQDARGGLAIYCAQACGNVVVDGIPMRNRLPILSTAPAVTVESWGLEFGLPDAEHLQAWGVGDVSGVLQAQDVVVVSWAGPTQGAAERVAQVGAAALEAGQWFEDLDSGMVYDAASFQSAIERYRQPAPDITAFTLIEGVQSSAGTRLVTHGLSKVGLPELVIEGIPADEENAMALAINATAQTIYEQGLASRLTIDAGQIASPTVRAASCEIQGEVTLQKARPGPDSVGLLVSVDFDGGFGQCGPVEVAPAPEQVPELEPEPQTLNEARQSASDRLNGPIQDAFQTGLLDGSTLMVKAPFQGTRRSVEWLWLSVEQWRDDGTLIGELLNQPTRVESLSKGDEVAVELSVVFDYVLVHPDGRREGNTTARFVR